MSNTDGEDTQRIEGLNPGDKAYILTEEQYIKFEKQNDVIADLKFKLKNDAIFQEYSDLEKELTSLREQLKQKDQRIKFVEELLNEDLHEENKSLKSELKQQEEVIRELTSSLTYIVETLGTLSTQQDELEALAYYEALRAIQKAKSLTTKDKCSED